MLCKETQLELNAKFTVDALVFSEGKQTASTHPYEVIVMSVFDRASSAGQHEQLRDASEAFREVSYKGHGSEPPHDSHKFVQHMQQAVRKEHGWLPEITWKGNDWYMQTEYNQNGYCVPYLVDGKPVKDCHPYR